MGKKMLAPFFLAILLITTLEMVPEVAGDDLKCDIPWQPCTGVCFKSGECMRCCKKFGYYHGRCIFTKGDGCYCCHEPKSGQQLQH
ncbi:hypothetical protein BRADI_3g05200v3 [Brachypodium distachyon]|uniref:Knottin scorpion toxin-like domain-containing protein n=1 Tax=Brachypodium distachyon TaxID=15368 RepID=I1HXN9_BRADI|nr:hypothetical protein BRADI_3g05200v3 [Brachypodium distachyon]